VSWAGARIVLGMLPDFHAILCLRLWQGFLQTSASKQLIIVARLLHDEVHDYAMHMWLNKISCRRQYVVIDRLDSWRCYSLYTVYASDLRQLLQVTAWGFQVFPHVSAIRRLASAKSLRTLCTLSSVSKASIVISPHGRTAGSCSERGPHALRIYVKRCQKEGLTVKPNETRLMFLKRSMHWSGSMQWCASTSSNTPRFQEFVAIGANGG
jgi:hypothetical protein